MKPTTETPTWDPADLRDDEWRDIERHPRNWPVGARVRLNVRPDRRECWPWILPPDGALATVAVGPDGDRDVTWVPVGPTGEIFVRFDGEHDTNDGLPVRLCASDLTLLTEAEAAKPESADPDPDPSCRTCGDHGFQSHDCPDCGK